MPCLHSMPTSDSPRQDTQVTGAWNTQHGVGCVSAAVDLMEGACGEGRSDFPREGACGAGLEPSWVADSG